MNLGNHQKGGAIMKASAMMNHAALAMGLILSLFAGSAIPALQEATFVVG
jgi:hypothetical protein